MSRHRWSAATWGARILFWIGYPFFWLVRSILFRVGSVSKPLSRRKVNQRTRQTKKQLFTYEWIEKDSFSLWQRVLFWWSWWTRPKRKKSVQESAESTLRPPVSGFLASVLLIMILSVGVGWWSYNTLFRDLPSPDRIRERPPKASTKIYDRHGELLYTIFLDQNRTLVPLEQVSPYAIQATLAIEDAEFAQHWGVSFRGIARAVWHNLNNDTLQGGSTITQQLVKMTLLTHERTWQRKAREALLALSVEARYTKDEILYYYLNEVNYGGSVYGIEEASHWYFDKPASQLTLAESAFLAGLPQSPSRYSPFGTCPQCAFERQHEVLRRMQEVGMLSEEERLQAQEETLSFRTASYDIKAPHFVMYIRSLLAERFGEDLVSQGGLEVYTTLDLAIQASAEAAIAKEIERLGRLKVSNGAAMVSDPRSGEVLAMVGSRDYFDAENDGSVNVPLRPRQPGSSIKPVTYAVAFEKGFNPSTLIDDTPVVYTSPGAPPYAPKNYDGRFRGKVTLREALGSSYNIPAVRLLVDVGLDAVIAKGRAMGITTWDDPSRFGLALTLGSGEVKMYDMMQVYGTFANNGLSVPLNPLIAVRSYKGETLYSNPCVESVGPCNARRTVSPLAAYQITSILTDNQARTPAFGGRSVLVIPNREVAVKTGTTNSLRDNWTFGYTPERVVGVWVGNNDNTPMSAVASGVTGASPIWHNIMLSQVSSSTRQFALPAGLTKVKVCRTTGTLPCAECRQVVEEVYPEGLAPTKACTAEMFASLPEDPQKTARR